MATTCIAVCVIIANLVDSYRASYATEEDAAFGGRTRNLLEGYKVGFSPTVPMLRAASVGRFARLDMFRGPLSPPLPPSTGTPSGHPTPSPPTPTPTPHLAPPLRFNDPLPGEDDTDAKSSKQGLLRSIEHLRAVFRLPWRKDRDLKEDLPAELPDFSGIWKCVDTWNLDQFLKAVGIPYIQRIAASKAPWPWWSFEHNVSKDVIHFVNHGPLGDTYEDIDLSGKEYECYDAKRQRLMNTAHWEGPKLVIYRRGAEYETREDRLIDEKGVLNLTLTLMSGPYAGEKWGRKFVRGDAALRT